MKKKIGIIFAYKMASIMQFSIKKKYFSPKKIKNLFAATREISEQFFAVDTRSMLIIIAVCERHNK